MLKNKDNGEVLFVVVFSLIKKKDVENEGGEEEEEAKGTHGEEKDDERHEGEATFQPRDDDLD